MRRIAIVVAAASLSIASAFATPSRSVEFGSADQVQRWINVYRFKPDVDSVPAAVRALSEHGAFKEPESAGIYVGFIAGVLAANPARAEQLVNAMFPLAERDHWAIIRAIAYSGLPEWKALLSKAAKRMPTRHVMIDKYLTEKLGVLEDFSIVREASWWEKVKRHFANGKDFTDKKSLDANADLLDTYWGYYFASGNIRPVVSIIGMLPWSKDRNDVEKLTVGSMAKYTLASNAARDSTLLVGIKRASLKQSADVLPILNEVIEAAETVELTKLRKEALAAIEDIKRKGPGYRRDIAWWGQVGEGAIGVGCITAAALGTIVLGLPCVVGGAATTATIRYLSGPQ